MRVGHSLLLSVGMLGECEGEDRAAILPYPEMLTRGSVSKVHSLPLSLPLGMVGPGEKVREGQNLPPDFLGGIERIVLGRG